MIEFEEKHVGSRYGMCLQEFRLVKPDEKRVFLKKVSVAVFAAVVGGAAFAATYKVDLDRPDGIYRCGEMATFTVRLLEKKNLAGSKPAFAVLDNFGTTVFTNMPLDVSSVGAVFKISGTLREPGFLRLTQST